jgi:hypothetical protein
MRSVCSCMGHFVEWDFSVNYTIFKTPGGRIIYTGEFWGGTWGREDHGMIGSARSVPTMCPGRLNKIMKSLRRTGFPGRIRTSKICYESLEVSPRGIVLGLRDKCWECSFTLGKLVPAFCTIKFSRREFLLLLGWIYVLCVVLGINCNYILSLR